MPSNFARIDCTCNACLEHQEMGVCCFEKREEGQAVMDDQSSEAAPPAAQLVWLLGLHQHRHQAGSVLARRQQCCLPCSVA